MSNFNPDEFAPKPKRTGGSYFNLKDIEGYPDKTARVRFLMPVLQGKERWTHENRPVRIAEGQQFPEGIQWRSGKDKLPEPAKSCFISAIYNVTAGGVFQAACWSQKTFQEDFNALMKQKDDDGVPHGDPREYDIIIVRSGEGTGVRYALRAASKKAPLPPKVAAEWARIQSEWTGLAAMFSGGDPFATFDTVTSATEAGDGDIPF